MNEIRFFSIIVICLLSSFVLLKIYVNERRIDAERNVRGIMWFGLATLAWAVGYLFEYCFSSYLASMNCVGSCVENNFILISAKTGFSLLNSLFILLTLPSIEMEEKRNIIVELIEEKGEQIIIGGYLLLSFVITSLILFMIVELGANNIVLYITDFIISFFVAVILLVEVSKAFSARNMSFMKMHSIILFLLILVTIVLLILPITNPEVTKAVWYAVVYNFSSITFKVLLIFFFFILIYSSKVIQQPSISTEPRLKQMQMQLQGLKIENEYLLEQLSKNDILFQLKEDKQSLLIKKEEGNYILLIHMPELEHSDIEVKWTKANMPFVYWYYFAKAKRDGKAISSKSLKTVDIHKMKQIMKKAINEVLVEEEKAKLSVEDLFSNPSMNFFEIKFAKDQIFIQNETEIEQNLAIKKFLSSNLIP